MRIEVLGTGCAKCNMLETSVKAAAEKLGIEYELEHVTDLNEIASRGVMITPALLIDGRVRVCGKVPVEAEITSMLRHALASCDE
jgi:small redox-active disulfide protein 2